MSSKHTQYPVNAGRFSDAAQKSPASQELLHVIVIDAVLTAPTLSGTCCGQQSVASLDKSELASCVCIRVHISVYIYYTNNDFIISM